jgi:hypothetical protein
LKNDVKKSHKQKTIEKIDYFLVESFTDESQKGHNLEQDPDPDPELQEKKVCPV